MNEHVILAGRVREALNEVNMVVERALALRDRAQELGDIGYWDAVSLNLHGFYTAVERILEEVARTMDGSLPEGPQWHRELLLQLSASLNGIRPAVLTRETRHCLDEYRSFRHVVRNLYTFNLQPARIDELAAGVRACYELVDRDLNQFANFLQELDRQMDS